MVAARLKEGYTVADLQAAIDGNHRSLFHCGDNDRGQKYHAVHLIFRSSDHVRQFMEIPSNGQVVAPANVKNIGALNAWLENER